MIYLIVDDLFVRQLGQKIKRVYTSDFIKYSLKVILIINSQSPGLKNNMVTNTMIPG